MVGLLAESYETINHYHFDITRVVIWQKRSGAREQGTIAYKTTKLLLYIRKTNRIELETLYLFFTLS